MVGALLEGVAHSKGRCAGACARSSRFLCFGGDCKITHSIRNDTFAMMDVLDGLGKIQKTWRTEQDEAVAQWGFGFQFPGARIRSGGFFPSY